MTDKWAVINQQGQQYLVKEGETIEIEKITGKKGEEVKFNEVLLLSEEKKLIIGQPLVKQAYLLGEIKDQVKTAKITVAKFKAKSRYRRSRGHRQLKTFVKIKKIISSEQSKKTSQ